MIAFSNSEALFLTSPTGVGLRPYPGRDSRQRPVYLLNPLDGEPALLFVPKYRHLYRPSLEPTNFSETSVISSPSTLSPSWRREYRPARSLLFGGRDVQRDRDGDSITPCAQVGA